MLVIMVLLVICNVLSARCRSGTEYLLNSPFSSRNITLFRRNHARLCRV
jgi:hypothetical protein